MSPENGNKCSVIPFIMRSESMCIRVAINVFLTLLQCKTNTSFFFMSFSPSGRQLPSDETETGASNGSSSELSTTGSDVTVEERRKIKPRTSCIHNSALRDLDNCFRT